VLDVSVAKRVELWRAYYAIRDIVGNLNVTSGISTKLTQKALLERLISELHGLTSSNSLILKDPSILAAQLQKIGKTVPTSDHYGYRDKIDTGILSESDFKTLCDNKADLKKKKVKLDDELLELNVRTEVELPENVVEVLKKYNIL